MRKSKRADFYHTLFVLPQVLATSTCGPQICSLRYLMTIGIDGTALYGNFGGVELALWNLLLAQNQLEIDATTSPRRWVVYLPHDGPTPAQLEIFGLNWNFVRLNFRGEHKARRIAWQQMQLPLQARRDGCDLLHCPTYVCPLRAPLPIVLTIYDLIALSHPQFVTTANRLHYGQLLPRSARRADRIIVPSPFVAREIARRVPRAHDKTRVVPLGVEAWFQDAIPANALAEARERLGLPARFLLFVGNPEPKKNVASIVAAMQQLPPRLRQIPLVATGGARAWHDYQLPNTYDQTPLHNQRALTAGAAVAETAIVPFNQVSAVQTLVLDFVPREELPALFALCEALVFPSFVEGFGLPVLEALACGAPVIASNRVPLENLETAALIIDPHDTNDLAQNIARVLEDSDLRDNLRARGREFAAHYSWSQTAQLTLQVYDELRRR